MAKPKPEYDELPEFNKLAKEIVAKYPDIFASADPELHCSNIKCFEITNKELDPDDLGYYEIKGISDPVRKVCEVGYVVVVNGEEWRQMTDSAKQNFVMCIMKRIPVEAENEGKVNPLDYKDDGMMVRTHGADWIKRNDLPDILKDEMKWVN